MMGNHEKQLTIATMMDNHKLHENEEVHEHDENDDAQPSKNMKILKSREND